MLADIVSYSRGKHQIRFGAEMRQGHVNEFYYRHSLGKLFSTERRDRGLGLRLRLTFAKTQKP